MRFRPRWVCENAAEVLWWERNAQILERNAREKLITEKNMGYREGNVDFRENR